jgi:transcriptional regulator with XRE-family HTH domain
MKKQKDDLLSAIGSMLRASRQRKELTQEALAGRVGINPKHLGRIERGESNIRIKNLQILCNELEISLPHFFRKVLEYKKTAANARKGATYLPRMDLIKRKKK